MTLCYSGDRTVTGQCDPPPEMEVDLRHRHTLLLSCTDITQHNGSVFTGRDCVNGSMLANKAECSTLIGPDMSRYSSLIG